MARRRMARIVSLPAFGVAEAGPQLEESGPRAGALSTAADEAGRSGIVSRLGWGVTDQALSSLTNFALGFLVAHSVSTREFGQFGLAFAAYLLALGVSRSVNTEPLVVRFSGGSVAQWRQATAMVTGGALGMGTVVGLACGVVGLMLNGSEGKVLMALGLGLPGLLLQDSWRWAFIAAGRASLAAANDLVWALLLFPGLALFIRTGHSSVAAFVVVWGAAGWVAGLYGTVQAALLPRPDTAPRWWRDHRDLSLCFVGEFVALGGGTQLSLFGIGSVAGLVAVGALRAGWLVLGPFSLLMMGVRLAGVPEGVRALRRSVHHLRRTTVLISAALGAMALLWGAVAVVLPGAVGRALLSSNWEAGRAVLLPLTAYSVASGVSVGAAIGMRTLAAAGGSLRVRMLTAPALVLAGMFGAARYGAYGAAWGLALANTVATIAWWWLYAGLIRARADEPSRRPS
jgi:hypothetical protein